VAPDVDLLLRLVDGQNHHQREVHSVGFALIATLASILLAKALALARPLALGFLAGSSWLSHLLLDYMAVDTSPPIGIDALWPLSRRPFHFPWPVFGDTWRTLSWSAARHDALEILWEIAVLAVPLAVALHVRFRAKG